MASSRLSKSLISSRTDRDKPRHLSDLSFPQPGRTGHTPLGVSVSRGLSRYYGLKLAGADVCSSGKAGCIRWRVKTTLMALLGHGTMSDKSPLCDQQRTSFYGPTANEKTPSALDGV